MFLSKIWFVLVGLLAGVALTAAFVAPRPADRRIEQLEGQRLDRAQYAAEQMLKTDAHRWIDYVAKLGRDAVLSESLDAASRGAGESKMVHETVRSRLHTLVPDLPGIGVETLVAVDAKGQVVARIGEREKDYGEPIAGAEAVGDALRGFLSDDVWGAGGKLRRIAAAPVFSKTRDRIVGAVYVGAETGKRLAELWKKNLGVDVAVLLKKQIVSSTLNEAVLSPLPDMIEARKKEIADAKRTRAMSLPMGDERLIAIAAPFAGMAAEQDAYYVLLGKKAPASNPWALLSSTSADDLKWGHFPWLPIAGGILAILVIGLWLQRYETEVPLTRLRKELRRVADGDVQKINDIGFPGKFGGVARDVNAALERFTHSPVATRTDGSRSDISRKDFNAILDTGVSSESRPYDAMGSSSFVPPSPYAPPAPSPFAPPPSAPSPFTSVPPAPPPTYASLDRGGGPPFGATPDAKLASPTFSSRPASGMGSGRLTPPPPPPSVPASRPPTVPRPPAAAALSLAPSPQSDQEMPTSFASEADTGDTTSQLDREERTRTIDSLDPEEAHVREVFAEFVEARRQCGEGTSSLTLEKFRAKLDANRQQLISKYNCRTARFSVYVKDGKAALKATPVRD